jgi:DinB superfamily
MLNPYASYLGERDPLTVIQATAGELAKLAAMPGRTPAPGKWDVRQILCHLADCEIAFAFRLRQAAAEDRHVIQPFNQDLWAGAYGAYDAAAALDVFRTLRQWNVKFIAAQPPAVFEKEVTHPERGTMTFRTIVETMAGHDLNHLGQVAALAN